MRFLNRTRVVAVCLTLSACTSSSPAEPSGTEPFSQTDIRAGAGAAAAAGNILIVNYTGWLYDRTKPEQKGLQFDSSARPGAFAFVLGAGQVIPGWDLGLVDMRAGGLRRLVIPPSLGYGNTRNGIVPPNATLVFEIELLEVQARE